MQIQINNRKDLKAAIFLLETKKLLNRDLMINQFHETYENLKPINFIKKEFEKVTHSPNLKNNVLNAAIGLGTGFITKKLFVGTSHNVFRKLFGTAIELVIAKIVSKNVAKIKDFGIDLLPSKKENIL